MICFKNKDYDQLARKMSWLGIDKDTFSRTNSKGISSRFSNKAITNEPKIGINRGDCFNNIISPFDRGYCSERI